jgi:alcohol dehydrogenase class IV
VARSHIVGYGSLVRIGELIDENQVKNILLVTGKSSYETCGAKDVIDRVLTGYSLTSFSDFDVNPKIEDAIRGTNLALDKSIDLILAIGGGSPMDMAKLIKAFMPTPGQAEALVRGDIVAEDAKIPLICVPTTAGSGSEATHFAVAYIGKDKFSLASSYLLPTAYVLDSALVETTSGFQKAVNGLDAMAQAIEGCWAASSTAETREWSYNAIAKLKSFLPVAVSSHDANELKPALQEVMEAANLAGRVINTTKTTAPHAFSYAFTSHYNVPHGQAVWMTLPAVFALHMRAAEDAVSHPKGHRHVKRVMKKLANMLEIESADTAEQSLTDFMRQLGVEPEMKKVGATTSEARRFLSSNVNAERLGNNPIKLTPHDIKTIFDF